MQGNRRPVGVHHHLLLVVVLAALLLMPAASAAPAAVDTYYSGRVVIVAGTGRMARRLEDEVAPELSSWAAGLSGRGNGDHISTGALNPNRQVCTGQCAAKGDSYTGTRPCRYQDRCPH